MSRSSATHMCHFLHLPRQSRSVRFRVQFERFHAISASGVKVRDPTATTCHLQLGGVSQIDMCVRVALLFALLDVSCAIALPRRELVRRFGLAAAAPAISIATPAWAADDTAKGAPLDLKTHLSPYYYMLCADRTTHPTTNMRCAGRSTCTARLGRGCTRRFAQALR